MKNAIANYENIFYFGGAALSGVFSFDGGYNIETQPINVIGKGFLKQVMSSVPRANFSVSRFLVNKDPSFNLTGDAGNFVAKSVNGGLLYDGKYLGFQNAYLNSISLSCGIGEIPTVETSFDVYGGIGSGFNPSGNNYAGGVFTAQTRSIVLTCRKYCTNRITAFNINFNTPKQVIYGLSSGNSHIPIEVHNKFPIEVTTNFTLEVDDYQSREVFDYLRRSYEDSFSISIAAPTLFDIPITLSSGNDIPLTAETGSPSPEILYSYLKDEDDVELFNFNASDVSLVSEQINSTSDGLMSVKLSYKSYLN